MTAYASLKAHTLTLSFMMALSSSYAMALEVQGPVPVSPADIKAEEAIKTEQPVKAEQAIPAADGNPLAGHVIESNYVSLSDHLQALVNLAIEKSEQQALLERKSKYFHKPVQRAVAWGKDLIELSSEYKGLEQSSEAADVILDEKQKLKSKASVLYFKQKQADEFHRKIFTSMLQLAMGVGINDDAQRKKEVIDAALDELNKLVGKDKADATLEMITTASAKAEDPGAGKLLSILEIEKKSKDTLDVALKNDGTMGEIRAGLNKFNHRSKFARATAKVVNTGLSIAMLSPTFISPAAQLAWTAFVMCNGGPEEAKLLKEVYLGQRFESRWTTLNQEATLAVTSYNSAVATKNTSLMVVSKLLMDGMAEQNPPVQVASANKKSKTAEKNKADKKISEKAEKSKNKKGDVTAHIDDESKDAKVITTSAVAEPN